MKSLQLGTPHAIIVIGIQGSGKSFFAGKFAETFKSPFMDESVFMLAARDRNAGKQLMNDVVLEFLKTGRSIVLEYAVSTRSARSDLTKLLKKHGYTPLYVWVQVDPETAMARSYKLHKISEPEYRETLRGFGIPTAAEKMLVISGKHTFATQARAVLKRLSVPRSATPQQSERPQSSRGQIIVR